MLLQSAALALWLGEADHTLDRKYTHPRSFIIT